MTKQRKKCFLNVDAFYPALISFLAIIFGIAQLTKGRIGAFIFAIIVAGVFGGFARSELTKNMKN